MSSNSFLSVRSVNPGTHAYDLHTVNELCETIRVRDLITYEHCRRVAIYTQRLARHLGWSRSAVRDLALAALVHDLGKTWIENGILHKESALSSDEWDEMYRHPTIAARMLKAYGLPETITEAVLHHHERFDGQGYPDALAGGNIPLGARVLAVADVFDALTSARSYKEPMTLTHARDWITAGAGVQFDPQVVATFVALVNEHPDFLLPVRVEPLRWPEAHSHFARHDIYPD